MAGECKIPSLELLYWLSPPFLNDGTLPTGLIYDGYDKIVSACCPDANSTTYKYFAFSDASAMLRNATSANMVAMPVFVSSSSIAQTAPSSYIKVLQLDGISLT
jgi:hypothetical protein